MERYNISNREPLASPSGRLGLPATAVVAGGAAHRRSSAWAVSATGHAILLALAVAFLRAWPPVAPQARTPVEMVFQAPAAARQPAEVPAPAPGPTEPLAPPPPDAVAPAEAALPPPPPAAPAPQVRQAVARPRPKPAARAATPVDPAPAGPSAAGAALSAPPGAAEPPLPPLSPIDGGWLVAVGAWLAAHKTYPEPARSRGEEGRVTVRLTIGHDGRITGFDVLRGSGSDILDDAARAMLRGAVVPPLPLAMTQASVTITVQIRYALTP